MTFYFLPADITTQTINFGLPAPLDIQVSGRNLAADQKVAHDLAEKIGQVHGAVDIRIQQPDDYQRFMFSGTLTNKLQKRHGFDRATGGFFSPAKPKWQRTGAAGVLAR